MLSYKPFFNLISQRGITTYELRLHANISSSTLKLLKNNESVSTYSLEKLCKYLNCRIENLVVYIDSINEK
jgi:DNA-binding Xre family transcriptional regulator